MAARKRPFSPAKLIEMRERISTTKLMQRLENHALGEVEMSATQIKAAEILLRKCIPDLSAVEHSGEVEHKRAAELSDDVLLGIATGSGAGTSPSPGGEEVAPSVH